jgi:hypothetical protein
MSDNFQGSIAQANVQFPIETVIEPLAGENYSKAVIFAPLSKASDYLPGVTNAQAKTLTELSSNNYGSITGGLLKTWLVPFFTSAQSANVGVVLYDDAEEATLTLSVCYEAFKMYAYFKFIIAEEEGYVSAQNALAILCLTDTLYSDCWIGTSDSNVLTKSSSLITQLKQSNANARVIYHPDSSINPALAQLGKSLAAANATGTPVGNSVDMVAFNTIGASGAEDADGNSTNLSATEKSALDEQKIGYVTFVGDGTSNVAVEGSLTLQGDSVGANWVKNYITYMCKVKTANMITQLNKFRNNATYQAILLILTNQVKGFLDMGRLDNFVLTAPVFADLPESGDTITVNNAWQADYIDNTRAVTVYGTLYITQPTR